MTPEQFYAANLNKLIDVDGYPKDQIYQCIDGFRWFLKCNSIPDMATPDNRASGYWTCLNQKNELVQKVADWQSKYFDKITDPKQFRNGDWVIFGWCQSHPETHVCMYYNGQSFGENQSKQFRGFTLKQTTWDDCLGALRWKGYETKMEILNGIDISNWQKGLDLTRLDYYDFVICKATEGIGFVDQYCDSWIQQAKAMGKKWGFYHFARPDANDPIREADFFVSNTREYFGEGLPVLDVEVRSENVVEWCRAFLARVIELTGIKPMIYMSEQSFEGAYDWSPVVALDCGLWLAAYRFNKEFDGYAPNNAGVPPSTHHWPFVAMWQYTSDGRLPGYGYRLDFDVFYGSAAVWDKYVGQKPESIPDTGDTNPEPDPVPGPEPTPEKPEDPEAEDIKGLLGMSNRTYDLLKWICLVVVPSFCAMLTNLADSLGIDDVMTIVKVLTPVAAFVGAILGFSSIEYARRQQK